MCMCTEQIDSKNDGKQFESRAQNKSLNSLFDFVFM